MAFDSKTGLFFWVWRQVFQSRRKLVTFLPFALYAVLQLLVLAGLVFFTTPPFSLIFLPLQRALYGEAVLHYPNNFIVLPQLFDTLNIVLSGLVGILTIGSATLLFFSNSREKPANINIAPVRKRYFHLFAAWIGETALVLGIVYGFVWLAAKLPSLGVYLTPLRIVGVVLVSSIFAFTTALILIEKKPFFVALPQSARIFASYSILTLVLVGLPSVAQLPVHLVLSNVVTLVRRLNPETIAFVIGAGVILSMIANYFIVGTITNLYAMTRKTDVGSLKV